MASGVQITGLIKPLNDGSFPVFEDIDGLGGFRVVQDTTARDAIPANYRKVGMTVYCVDNVEEFQLLGGIDNSNWVGVPPGGGYSTVEVDGTPLAQETVLNFQGPSVTGADGGGASNVTIIAQVVAPDVAGLAAFDCALLGDGDAAQVAGLDFYYLNTAPIGTGNIDGVNVIAATNPPVVGSVWERQYDIPAGNQVLTTIYVNGGTGNDGARNPSNPGTPLKTLNEAFTRISRQTQGSAITINYTGTDQSLDCDISGILPPSGSNTSITIVGDVQVLDSQTITAYFAPDPTTNSQGQVQWTTHTYPVNSMLELDGSQAVSWVMSDDESHTNIVTDFMVDFGFFSPPTPGATINNIDLSSRVNNVTCKLPEGYKLILVNIQVDGLIACATERNSEAPEVLTEAISPQITFRQCIINPAVGGDWRGPASAYFENCFFSFAPTFLASAAVIAGGLFSATPMFDCGCDITMYGGNFLTGMQVFGGSYVKTNVLNGTARPDFFINPGGSQNTTAIDIKDGGLLDISDGYPWGTVINGTLLQFLRIINNGVVVYKDKPKFTGFINAYGLASRVGLSFNDWPVVAPKLGGYIIQSEPEVGIPDASLFLENQHANISATSIFPLNGLSGSPQFPHQGLYRVSAYLVVTSGGTVGAISVNVTFTDDTGTPTTVTLCTSASIVAISRSSGQALIETNGSSAVNYSTTGIVTPGGLAYELRLVSELISDG